MQALFVHGMGRTPLSGRPLLCRLRAAGLKTSTFGYSAATHNFSRIVARLSSRVAQLARHGDYVLIGHSLGGLLLRSALASLPPGTRQPTRVFLLGSPIRSARLAKMLQHNPIYRVVTGDCGQLLASDERMNRIDPVTAPTTGIYGVRGIRPTFNVFSHEPNDGIVSVTETSAPWISDEVRVPVVHSFLPSSTLVAANILERIDGVLKSAAEDLPNRRPVWEALSDMFLDTDVSLSTAWRVSVLVASPYPVNDLEKILVDEVYPICKYNLRCVAGEWAGFDQKWLEEEILRRMTSRWRFLHLMTAGRLASCVPSEWSLTKTAIISARKERSTPGSRAGDSRVIVRKSGGE